MPVTPAPLAPSRSAPLPVRSVTPHTSTTSHDFGPDASAMVPQQPHSHTTLPARLPLARRGWRKLGVLSPGKQVMGLESRE